MTDEEIHSHSYSYLFEIYKEYPERACENLGVSSDKKEEKTRNSKKKKNTVQLSDSDYPKEFIRDKGLAQKYSKQFNGLV